MKIDKIDIDNHTIACSARCGYNCSKHDQCIAIKRATELANKLGKGWEGKVTHNLGWFYGAEKQLGHVLLQVSTNYNAVKTDVSEVGYTGWVQSSPQFIESDKSPSGAITKAKRAFCEYHDNLTKMREEMI